MTKTGRFIMMHLLVVLITPLICTAATVNIRPLQFTLDTDQSSSTTTWSSRDLDAFSSAAKEYIDGNSLLQSSLGLSRDEYKGVSFTSSVSNGRGRVRRLQNTLDVTLQGTVKLSSDVLPTEERLAEIVAALFENGEKLFVKQIVFYAELFGASDWLRDVDGYDVARIESTAVASESNTPGSQISQIQNVSTDSDDDNNSANLFIIFGIAGAAISFLLLLAGLCYAKRSHDIHETKKSTPTPSPQKKSILKNNSQTTTSLSPSSMPSPLPMPDETSDDESNADFMLARAALNNTHSSIQARRVASGGGSVIGGVSVVSGANSSYADDNMSYAFSVDGQSMVGSKVSVGDVAIGAGGISAFQNESGGVFKWNEDGTKMVYIPAVANNAASNTEKAQNGFIYDEVKKKWVLERRNVSFQREDAESTVLTPPRKITRSRTDDSCVTGFTEFSYDDVAGNREIRLCPSTPQDEGVEVGMEDIGGRTYINDDASEFHPNTNVERFIIDDGDESTMFGSVLDGAESITLPPPPPPPPPPRPQPMYERPESPDRSMITEVTLEPGVIKRVPVVHEDKPFDEDIPFDERPRPQSKFKPKINSKMGFSKHISRAATDDGSESGGSIDSARVLNDLNKLSKFMTERKRSSQGAR